jgi:hypothetical protein
MQQPNILSAAVALAMALPGAALAEIEISGYLKNETSFFTQDGQMTGQGGSVLDGTSNDSFDVRKFQNQARFFVNGDVGESSSWHADINLIYDTEGVNSKYRGHENYTAYDYLRELYLDTELAGWYMRLGKQQVVWGTADGIKLLDIINPTDYRELNQDTMEDSRIPIWMINAEHDVGDNGNVQLIIAQSEENKIPGLNADGDGGHAFIMKGVDSITGEVNGFLNVAPRLANVASSFSGAAQGGMFTGNLNPAGLVPFTGLTVDGFASNPDVMGFPCPPTGCDGTQPPVSFGPGSIVLNNIAQNGLYAGDPNGNNNQTNLMPVTGPQPQDVNWNPRDSSSAFEYMSNATFATFNTFAGNAQHSAVKSQYVVDKPDDSDLNYGARYKGSTDGGLNFSLNYFYHYDANPAVDVSWHDAVSGQRLNTELRSVGTVLDPNTGAALADGALVSRNNVPGDIHPFGVNTTTVLLRNPRTNQYYGATNPDLIGSLGSNGLSPNGATLRFTEHYERIHSIGASFDYAFDAANTPIVIRGEFLYDKDTRAPIVDKRLLAIGDLEGALRTEKTDMFKYVLGAEVNVLTNLLVSAQFIQFINMDYEDTSRTCTTQAGNRFDCSKYSADPATLHLSNGMQKAEEFDTFVSLFLSKPFGPSDEHRVNNIIIWEEGGGWWNRFDVEYTFTDELLGSFEWNQYWGDEDTTFGQFENSSNLQVGLKYIF